jgi:putative transposase
VSIQCACSVLRAERSSCHYKGKRRPQAVLMKRIREIAETRIRCGGRRIRVQLRREGWRVNAKRVLRLCR